MVVKPCIGWNSDCVSKVSNEADLAEAIRKAAERHSNSPKQSTAVVVEPYIDGPEVDANFVLLDGEILFFEICDDFPCKADAEEAGLEDNFQETQMVFPTSLPDREIAAIRDSIHKSILRQGFSSGIFHCEARVRHSRVHYRVQDGILDLEEKTEAPSHEVSVYLLEINARTPGYPATVAVQLCYGVDYYALRLLQCVGSAEDTRVRALSQPFLNGPQFTLAMTVVPPKQAGIMKTADVGLEFLERHQQLRDQIPDYKTSKKGGDVIEGPSSNALWWIAYFSVFSRVGRRDCLKLSQFIRENCSYEVE
ncbi:ATP-grasp superfamily protein [Rutstroemia sp. NJR-2017a BBW]|nr:ATP-grasp superfamily protein [Rutstroemia sp. NJR-2017a BBW]